MQTIAAMAYPPINRTPDSHAASCGKFSLDSRIRRTTSAPRYLTIWPGSRSAARSWAGNRPLHQTTDQLQPPTPLATQSLRCGPGDNPGPRCKSGCMTCRPLLLFGVRDGYLRNPDRYALLAAPPAVYGTQRACGG
jgi:hypothetical protein